MQPSFGCPSKTQNEYNQFLAIHPGSTHRYSAPVEYEFAAEIWLFPGKGGWCFLSLPAAVADDIADGATPQPRGFGAVRVEAVVGETVWRTSIFPDKQAGTYVLPVKKAVRHAEGIEIGDVVACRLRVLGSN